MCVCSLLSSVMSVIIYFSSLQRVVCPVGTEKCLPVFPYSIVYIACLLCPFWELKINLEVTDEASLAKSGPKTSYFSCFQCCQCIHCSQGSFLVQSIYLHYSWSKCCLAAVKHIPSPNTTVYIFWSFVITEPFQGLLKSYLRITDNTFLAEITRLAQKTWHLDI